LRVLLTGAGGFSGAYVADDLLARGHSVIALTGRHSMGRLGEAAARAKELTVLLGDLADDGLALPDDIDAIIHTAAASPASGITAQQMLRDNAVATARLVRYAVQRGVDSFVYYSSLSVYGRIETPLVDPATPMVDPDVYGQTKRLGELMLQEASGSFRSVAIRLPGILGAGSVRNWMTGVLAAARQDQDIPIFNPDAPFNNAVHVTELASFASRLLETSGWSGFIPVTVGARGAITVEQAVRLIMNATCSRGRIIAKGNRSPCFMISNEGAFTLGYAPSEINNLLLRFVAENHDLSTY
jgi:nucleoside-diphosphate-sugar epimerase